MEVNRRYQELIQTDGYVTAAKLKDAYFGIGVKQETLLKLFEWHNAEFVNKVGHSRAKGTQRYTENVDRGYLTKTEIQTLMDAPMKNTYHELVRDLFIFSVFTGLAYSDMKILIIERRDILPFPYMFTRTRQGFSSGQPHLQSWEMEFSVKRSSFMHYKSNKSNSFALSSI